jgi:sialic acid synthase SpsE
MGAGSGVRAMSEHFRASTCRGWEGLSVVVIGESGEMTMIIAEISGNHGGDLGKACKLIAAAARCGCDAVKFQLYLPEDLDDPANKDGYEKYHVPETWLESMFNEARLADIKLFASVFAPWAVEALEPFAPFAYKIASPESTRLPDRTYHELAAAVRRTSAELFVSSGLADLGRMVWFNPDVLFYCKWGYPAELYNGDLQIMRRLRGGFSDHSAGVEWPLAMIAAGATHIEKHFKLDGDCVDAAFSLDPEQMKLLCDLAHQSW